MFFNVVFVLILFFCGSLCEDRNSIIFEQNHSNNTLVNPHYSHANFEEIWYINLDSHKYRRDFQEEQLSLLGIPYNRKSAIHVNCLDECINNSTLLKVVNRIPSFFNEGLSWQNTSLILPRKSQFVLSVFLSHLTLYEDILAKYSNITENKLFLILEDDAKIESGFKELFEIAFATVPDDFEVLRLGFWGASRDSDQLSSSVFKAKPPFWDPETDIIYYGGAHAVCLQLKTLASLINKLETMKLGDIDGMMTSYPLINSYVFNQDLNIVGVEEFEEKSNPSKEDRELRKNDQNIFPQQNSY